MSDVLRSSIAGTSGIRRLSFARLDICCSGERVHDAVRHWELSGSSVTQPNIIFIMGDDIGWNNIGAYNQGIMSAERPI